MEEDSSHNTELIEGEVQEEAGRWPLDLSVSIKTGDGLNQGH